MSGKSKFSHDQLVFLYTLLGGLPAVVTSIVLLLIGDHSPHLQWTLILLIIGLWLAYAVAARMQVIRPLQVLANLLSALREGDFSIRAHHTRRDDALGDVSAEINTLSRTLQTQRLGAIEATALLHTVMEEIDVAIFAFDQNNILRLANRAGQKLLSKSATNILGRSASEIGLSDCLEGEASRILSIDFPNKPGRWGMRRTSFRESGYPHQLIVIGDLSQALREEELKAWQRLVRVLGHELNNSLTPIKSLSGSLASILRREKRLADWEDDMRAGLEIIESRADSLSRFMQAYASLAKLPPPNLAPCNIVTLIERVVALEIRLPVQISGGPLPSLDCDADQIEQLLINLVKNAVEAALQRAETPSEAVVRILWFKRNDLFEIRIEDSGPGLANEANLFVPFFTTKPSGTGIGLVLCRQIVENHGGSISLKNREKAEGCVAILRLPLSSRR